MMAPKMAMASSASKMSGRSDPKSKAVIVRVRMAAESVKRIELKQVVYFLK